MDIQRSAGILIIAGAIFFGIVVGVPDYTDLSRRIWSAPELEVGKNPRAWRWANTAFLISAVLTLIGIGLLTLLLFEEGSLLLATAGLLLFALGSAGGSLARAYNPVRDTHPQPGSDRLFRSTPPGDLDNRNAFRSSPFR
jgi:hypothetical protein